jgi:Family of unknown function (DUF5754)
MKLVSVKPAHDGTHKYEAVFDNDGRSKTTKFGAAGMDDYTKTHDKEQRSRYISRHSKDMATGDPTRAGFLSRYLLWGESTSMMKNLAAYRRRFNL